MRQQQCIPSAADLLLKQYIQLAQGFVDAATPQVRDADVVWPAMCVSCRVVLGEGGHGVLPVLPSAPAAE
jgi:hypothetical protein